MYRFGDSGSKFRDVFDLLWNYGWRRRLFFVLFWWVIRCVVEWIWRNKVYQGLCHVTWRRIFVGVTWSSEKIRYIPSLHIFQQNIVYCFLFQFNRSFGKSQIPVYVKILYRSFYSFWLERDSKWRVSFTKSQWQ